MTSYNYGRYLNGSIESVLAQTFVDLELVVVDDGSTDDSREIIRRYARQDPRVRPIFHRSNAGFVKTLNDGIDAARGRFIAFIDSDDLWARDKLEKQLAVLKADEDLVVWTEGEIIDQAGQPSGQRFTWLHRATRKKKAGDVFDEIMKGNFVLGSSLMVKKDNLEGIRFSDSVRYFADFPFFLDLAARYDFYFIDECLVQYRIHGGNTTIRNREWANADMIAVYEHALSKYRPRMSRKLLSKTLCYSSILYLRADRRHDSLDCLYRGIRTYPPNAYYLLLLPASIVKYRLRDLFDGRWNRYRRLASG
jgi:glycosyltransferase involved in cell wall biosynthesis